MRIVYSAGFHLDLGTHVFPATKYARLHDRLIEAGLVEPSAIVAPPMASWDDLALVHTTRYLAKARDGSFSMGEIFRLEIPWSPAIVEAFRRMTGGTIHASRFALDDGLSVQLGGGFHHAFPGHGEGFCLFNDVAVAVRVLQRDGKVRRAAVVDLDVHHGNGTAAIFAGDPDVFTLSLHQERNYPAEKPPGSLDVGLDDGTNDEQYLDRLRRALPRVVEHRPDLVVYLAGADPYRDDLLGGLSLTFDGLRARDALVFQVAREAGLPVAVTLAGGYARRLDDTVAIHQATVEEALQAARR